MSEDVKENQGIERVVVGDETYEVSSLSDNIQKMVKTYDRWRKIAAEKEDAYLMSKAALDAYAREILTAVKEEVEASNSDNASEKREEKDNNESQ